MGAVSFEDAWGPSESDPPAATPVPRAPVADAEAPRRKLRPRRPEPDRSNDLLLHEVRRLRVEASQRHSHMVMVVCVASALVALFLALSWSSHQKMIQHMSYVMWALDRTGSAPRPRLPGGL